MEEIGLIARRIVGKPLVNVCDADLVEHLEGIGRRLALVVEDGGNVFLLDRRLITGSHLERVRVDVPLGGVAEQVGREEESLFRIRAQIDVNLQAVQVTDERIGNIPDDDANAIDAFQAFLYTSEVLCKGNRHTAILLGIHHSFCFLANHADLCTLISMQRKFTIGLIQMACTPDPDENLGRAESRVEAAADAGAEVICLPELFRSQYFCQQEDAALFDLAEPVPGPSTQALGKIAKEKQVVVIAPIFERRAAGVYHNSAAIIDTTGEVAGLYRKMHIPDDPAYYEKFYFTPGDLGFRAFDTRSGRIAALICWDQWYPEGARLASLQGASVLFYPTAIGWHRHEKAQYGDSQRDAWRTIQRGHAIANGVYVAAVNRVGFEKPAHAQGAGLEFWGTSFVADPFGVVLKEASTDREELVLAEVDLERLEEVRRNWPFFRDRRIDAYAGITQRFLDEKTWHEEE